MVWRLLVKELDRYSSNQKFPVLYETPNFGHVHKGSQ
jgi:hypothetical protein